MKSTRSQRLLLSIKIPHCRLTLHRGGNFLTRPFWPNVKKIRIVHDELKNAD